MKMKLMFCVLMVFVEYCLCIQYHLKNQNKVSALTGAVLDIYAMKQTNKIGVLTGTATNWQVNILQGPTFTSTTKIPNPPNSKSLPIITPSQITTTTGQQLKSLQPRKPFVLTASTIYSSKMAVMEDLVLDSMSEKCPTLVWVEGFEEGFGTGRKEFQKGDDCKFSSLGFVERVGVDLFVYAAKYNIYVIKKNGLEVVQKIVETGPYKDTAFSYSSSYSLGKSSTLILQGQRNYYFAYSKDESSSSPSYVKQNQFFNPTSRLQLTGTNEGVSFYFTEMYKWRNVKNHILNLEAYDKTQFLEKKNAIAVYGSQKGFVLTDSGNLEFYQFNAVTFRVEKKYTYQTDYYGFGQRSGKITSDDKYMVGLYYYNQNKGVFIYSFEANQLTTLEDLTDHFNCSSFGLINDQQFVTICNSTNITYQLQLWSLSSQSIISTLQLPDTQKMNLVKIATNPRWNNQFAVMFKQNNDDAEDNCTTKIYKVVGGSIVDTGVENSQISFYQSYGVGEYLVSMKFIRTSDWDFQDSFLKIFRVGDLSEVYREFYSDAFMRGQETIYASGNYFIVQSAPQIGLRDGYVYNLDLPPQNSFVGGYFKLHSRYDIFDWLLFPKHGFIYFYSQYNFLNEPYRIVYDLKAPPLISVTRMSKSYENALAYLYINVTDLTLVQDNSCGLAFFIINSTLYKYKDCPQPQPQPLTPIPLLPNQTQTLDTARLFFSSDKKHLLISYTNSTSKGYLEIRALDKLGEVLWTGIENLDQIFNADLRSNGDIVYTSSNYIRVARFYPVEKAEDYDIIEFRTIELNVMGCMVFSGPSSTDSNLTNIIYKPTKTSRTHLSTTTPQTILLLALHPKCTYFASYQEDQTITIWQVLKDELRNVTTFEFQGVVKMTITAKDKIIVQGKGGIVVRDLVKKDGEEMGIEDGNRDFEQVVGGVGLEEGGEIEEGYGATGSKYALSQDGEYIAECANNNIVQIKNIADNSQLTSFQTPQSSIITGLAFSSNNSLYISTSLTTLFMLDPTPCPPNTIPQNLHCICPPSFTNTPQACQCPQGHIDQQNHLCIKCQQQQYFDQAKKQCLKCLSGYLDKEKGQCQGCAFPCATCEGNAGNCGSYVVGFYLLVVAGGLVVVGGVGGIGFWVWRRRRLRVEKEGSNLLTDPEQQQP